MIKANERKPTPGLLLIGGRCGKAGPCIPGLLAGSRELPWTLPPPEVARTLKKVAELRF